MPTNRPTREQLIAAAKSAAQFISKELSNPTDTSNTQLKTVLHNARFLIRNVKSAIIESQVGDPKAVNWLEGWLPFDVTGMSPNEISAWQLSVEAFVRDFMSSQAPPITNDIVFVWAQTTPVEYTLSAYLDPPAERDPNGGAGGTITPEQPPRP